MATTLNATPDFTATLRVVLRHRAECFADGEWDHPEDRAWMLETAERYRGWADALDSGSTLEISTDEADELTTLLVDLVPKDQMARMVLGLVTDPLTA